MEQSRFSEEQIIGIRRGQGSEQKTAEVRRLHGISQTTHYR